MRIIDKTPLQDANGEIGIGARIQGTLKYGLNWHAELEAQKAVIGQLDRLLEKGFVLIRNFTLPNSEIVVPSILIGSGGIWVIYITNVKGYFEAKGDQWNEVRVGRAQPARINLLSRVSQLTRAFQKYLEVQKFDLPVVVESILIASDPGAQIESLRPVARVVRSDAIKQFATSLMQTRPVLAVGTIYDLADQIIDPSLRKLKQQPAAPEEGQAQPAERARVIFDASERSGEFNPNDLGFAFEDEDPQQVQSLMGQTGHNPAEHPRSSAQPARAAKGFLGMSAMQVGLLAVLGLVEICILAGFAYVLFFLQ
jgi:hypothetical protein